VSRDEGFLSRWSRRKQDAQREAEAQPPDAAVPEASPTPEPAPEAAAGPASDELTPEEVAALPPVEAITAETDITAFLKKGVPAALRNAALRRSWSADPMIRDFVCEAREYAYDWNVPGGVPGSGELLPVDDVPAMLRRVFGEPEPASDAVSQARLSDEAAPAPERAPVEAEAGPTEGDAPSPTLPSAAAPPPAAEPPSSEKRPEKADISPPRRHGGATPV